MEDNKHGLEQQQVEELLSEGDVPLRTVTEKAFRVYILTGLVIGFTTILLSFMIKFSEEVNTPFTLKGGLKETVIRLPDEVYVQERFVSVGDRVREGDPIFRIQSQKAMTLLEDIYRQEQLLSFAQQGTRELKELEIEKLTKELALERKQIKSMESDLRSLTQRMNDEKVHSQKLKELLENETNRQRKLFEAGVISPADLETAEYKYSEFLKEKISSENSYLNEIRELDNRIRTSQNKVESWIEDIKMKRLDLEVSEAGLENTLEIAKNKLLINYDHYKIEKGSLILTSPHDGRISTVAEIESKISSGEILLRLETDSSEFYALGELTSEKIGLVHSGQKVIIKYESFPYTYYGTMIGTVERVSSSPNETGHFSCYVKILDYGDLREKVNKGMTGTLSVQTEELSLAQSLFKRTLKKISIE